MDNNGNNINGGDVVKDKIILFVIGVLIGAVISTAAFFVYTKTLGTGSGTSSSSSQQMPGGTPPEMPNGENGAGGQGNTPPAMPNGENSQGGSSQNGQSGATSTQSNNDNSSSQGNN